MSNSSELAEGTGLSSIIMTTRGKNPEFSALSFAKLCCAARSGQSCMQMNGGKLVEVKWLETDVGSELTL